MYKIKQQPEDFVVKEISSIKPSEGDFTLFLLKKRNYTTIKALEQIGKALHRPLKDFGFAGNKDRQAVTEQVCSGKGLSKVSLEKLEFKDIEIKYLGKNNKPVSLGELEGNYFEIVIRNIDNLPEIKKRFLNLFGEQRFSKNNAEIGKAIVKKDFKKAVELISQGEGEIEQAVKEHLKENPTELIGAIKKVPKPVQKIYIHAYQSKLWNLMAIEKAKETKDQLTLPLIGFGTTGKYDILYEEGITARDFIIKEIPDLSSEGSEREIYAGAEELEIGRLQDDELNDGKKKVLLKFKLGKGSYATEFIRQCFEAH